MIISVSRRTDIPAFYSEWFMNRLHEQYVLVRNPLNFHQVSKVTLKRDVIDFIVFWTKNAAPLKPFIPEIMERYSPWRGYQQPEDPGAVGRDHAGKGCAWEQRQGMGRGDSAFVGL